jgi:mono/diheme cytochrome c family protein
MRSQAGFVPAYSGLNDTFTMKLTFKHLLLGAPLALAAVLVAAPVAENWENYCAKCHGADGKGQTKAGRKLKVKDYTDAKVQAELKDEEMVTATSEGVTDKAGKEKMKAYKDELTPDEIKELVAYVRKFKT